MTRTEEAVKTGHLHMAVARFFVIATGSPSHADYDR